MEFKPSLSVELALQLPCVIHVPPQISLQIPISLHCLGLLQQAICLMNTPIVKLNNSEIINQSDLELKEQGLPEDPNFHVINS